MKSFALFIAFCAVCALVLADDTPAALSPCSFSMTAHVELVSSDNQVLGTSMNQMIRDNGEYWVWKSTLHVTDDFTKQYLPDHEWAIIWREDLKQSFRHDIDAQKCIVSSDLPTPFEWIESKTYGVVWFDEPVSYEGKEATLFTSIAVGAYGKVDFETTTNFYVMNSDGNLVHLNGTVSADLKELGLKAEVRFQTTSIYYEHNKPIDRRTFVINPPCPGHPAPSEPSSSFKNKCYKESASVVSVSWMVLLAAIIATLLIF